MTPDDPKILRVVSGYAVEWSYRYHGGKYIEKLDPTQQFAFLPGCFDRCLSKSPDIALTQDLDGKTIFARTSDGTLLLEPDDVGLLVTAKLVDNPQNRELCRLIDRGRVRGWSHRTTPTFGDWRFSKVDGVSLYEYRHTKLTEVTIVIRKFPRQKTRTTPIFLSGGPQKKVVANV